MPVRESEGSIADDDDSAIGRFGHERVVHQIETPAIELPLQRALQIQDGDGGLAPATAANDGGPHSGAVNQHIQLIEFNRLFDACGQDSGGLNRDIGARRRRPGTCPQA